MSESRMTIEEYNAIIFAQLFGQAATADTQRNLQAFTEALAKPVEGDTGQEEA